MPPLLLGVRKREKELVPVVYAKGSDPLMVPPVEFVPELPAEVKWERGEKATDLLTVTILGKSRTVVPKGSRVPRCEQGRSGAGSPQDVARHPQRWRDGLHCLKTGSL